MHTELCMSVICVICAISAICGRIARSRTERKVARGKARSKRHRSLSRTLITVDRITRGLNLRLDRRPATSVRSRVVTAAMTHRDVVASLEAHANRSVAAV